MCSALALHQPLPLHHPKLVLSIFVGNFTSIIDPPNTIDVPSSVRTLSTDCTNHYYLFIHFLLELNWFICQLHITEGINECTLWLISLASAGQYAPRPPRLPAAAAGLQGDARLGREDWHRQRQSAWGGYAGDTEEVGAFADYRCEHCIFVGCGCWELMVAD